MGTDPLEFLMEKNTQNISEFYREIKSRLKFVRQKQLSHDIIKGLFVLFIVLISCILFSSIIEAIFDFDTLGRTFLFTSVIFVLVIVFSIQIVVPFLRKAEILKSEDDKSTAIKVGKVFPHIHDRLLNAIQMFEHKQSEISKSKNPIYSYELIDAAFVELYDDIHKLDFSQVIDKTYLKKSKKKFFITLAIVIFVFVLSPTSLTKALYRVLNFTKEFSIPIELIMTVKPGNYEAVKGENVTIEIQTEGLDVKSLSLFNREEGIAKFENIILKPTDYSDFGKNKKSRFVYTISNIKKTIIYYVEAHGYKTEKYKINVVERPIIKSLQLTLNYPAYSKLPPKKLDENTGDVTALLGTLINFSLESSKKLKSAGLHFDDNSIVKLTVSENQANGSISLKKEKTYKIIITDERDLQNVDPIKYQLKIIPDEYPYVAIIVPGQNVDISENMLFNMLIRIKDDYGFSKLRLAYRLVHSRYEQPQEEFSFVDIPFSSKELLTQDIWYEWNLTGLNLVPEDVLAYYVEVFDNDIISGPKSSRSQTYLVRLPSLEEVFADVSQTQEQTIETMQNAVKEAEQLKKQMDELQREIKKNPQKTDWQQQKKIEELGKKYETLKKNITEAARKMEEMIKKMDENKLLSQQTLEKYFELQKLMEELKSPELQEALKKLQEKMQKMSMDQLKQVMEQLNFSEEYFKKNLERTIELLKRIHIEQKVDELIKRTQDLINQQKQLQEEVLKTDQSNKEKLESLIKQQQNIQEQIDKLQQEAKKLTEKMEEFPGEMPLEKMQKAEGSLSEKQLQKKSQKSIAQMQNRQMRQSSQTQQEMLNDMQDFMEQMQDVQKSMQEQMQKEVLDKMKKVVHNLIEISREQEALKEETRNLDPNSQRFRDNTQQQMDILENLNSTANSMVEISKKSFAISPEMGREIGNAMRQIGQALQNMEQRNPNQTSRLQTEAMASINRAAIMMQNAMNAMRQAGGKGMGMASLMQRLGQMSGMQAGINAQTAQAMGQGQSLTPQQMAEYARLAGQQAALQKSLEQLANEARNMGELSKLLGDLDKIAKDMAEVQTDLEQGNVNPETLRKQERILSRLLDSQRSMRERDFEKRRRAETAKDYKKISPADIDLTTPEGKNRLREELLKISDENYSKDFEDLIRKYFESLEKENF